MFYSDFRLPLGLFAMAQVKELTHWVVAAPDKRRFQESLTDVPQAAIDNSELVFSRELRMRWI
jgi:hypothetical protein